MTVSLLVFHLLMIGMMSLKKQVTIALLILPLPAVTILFFLFIQRHYVRPSTYLSLSVSCTLSEATPSFLQASPSCSDHFSSIQVFGECICLFMSSWCAVSCCAVPCRVVLYCFVSCRVVFCRILPYCGVVLCRAVPCRAVLCFAV